MGTRARTPEHFPRMKHRAARRHNAFTIRGGGDWRIVASSTGRGMGGNKPAHWAPIRGEMTLNVNAPGAGTGEFEFSPGGFIPYGKGW